MLVRLNSKAITDEIMALSALRAVGAGSVCDGVGRSFGGVPVTRDSLPGLRVVMRMVFAEVLMGLSGYVEECRMDEEDPEVPLPYEEGDVLTLELKLRDGVVSGGGRALAVKRHLEHVVAAGTLGWIATDADASFAELLQRQREGALSALKDVLAASAVDASPGVRPGWP